MTSKITIIKSNNKPIFKSVINVTNELVIKPVVNVINEPNNEQINKPVVNVINEPIIKQVNEQTNEQTNESTIKQINKSINELTKINIEPIELNAFYITNSDNLFGTEPNTNIILKYTNLLCYDDLLEIIILQDGTKIHIPQDKIEKSEFLINRTKNKLKALAKKYK